jgi:DNA-binding FadR family transcriptional regulator
MERSLGEPRPATAIVSPADGVSDMAVTFENIKQPKLAEIIAAKVREQIRTGILQIGTRLPPERDLIELFGVSRGTMREAMTLLGAQGFVDIRTGRNGGAYVTQPSVDNLVNSLDVLLSVHSTPTWQLLEARAYVEPIATKLACERASEEDLVRIQRSVDGMREALEASDDEAFRRHTVAFHVLIAEASHNELIRTLTVITQELIFSKERERLSSDPKGTIAAHERILELLRSRDKTKASNAMQRHVRAFEEHVTEE